MSYFQEYEARKRLCEKVKPGSVWTGPSGDIVISSVNFSRGTINGTWNSMHLNGSDTIKWLLRHYKLVED
jgi:hypothetical protein